MPSATNNPLHRIEVSTSIVADDLGLFESVKNHLSVVGGFEDAKIEDALRGAIDTVEEWTRRTIRKSVSATAHYKGWMRVFKLPRPPHVSVTSVKYYDPDNTLQTVSTDDYRTPTSTRNGTSIEFDWQYTFPNVYDRRDPIQVAYVAGFSDSAEVPGSIKTAIRLLAEHEFDGDASKMEEARKRLQSHMYRGD